jgi:hypothetical protein
MVDCPPFALLRGAKEMRASLVISGASQSDKPEVVAPVRPQRFEGARLGSPIRDRDYLSVRCADSETHAGQSTAVKPRTIWEYQYMFCLQDVAML